MTDARKAFALADALGDLLDMLDDTEFLRVDEQTGLHRSEVQNAIELLKQFPTHTTAEDRVRGDLFDLAEQAHPQNLARFAVFARAWALCLDDGMDSGHSDDHVARASARELGIWMWG